MTTEEKDWPWKGKTNNRDSMNVSVVSVSRKYILNENQFLLLQSCALIYMTMPFWCVLIIAFMDLKEREKKKNSVGLNLNFLESMYTGGSFQFKLRKPSLCASKRACS